MNEITSRQHTEKSASTAVGRANPGRLGALSEIAALIAEQPDAPATLQGIVGAAVRATAADAGTLVVAETPSGPVAFSSGSVVRTVGGPLIDVELRLAGPSLGWLTLARAGGRQAFSESDALFAQTLATQIAQALETEAAKRGLGSASPARRRPSLRALRRPAPAGVEGRGWSIGELRAATPDLVTLTRLETEPLTGRPEPVVLAALLERRAGAFVPQAAERGIRLRVEERGPGAVVRAALADVELAVDALVANAIEATPAGGTVVLAAEVEGNSVRVAIEDGGDGVDPDTRERIFEPFAAHSRNRALGFALVGAVARRAGGRAAVEDAASGGGRFVLELPSA